jgi:hypothetical protein
MTYHHRPSRPEPYRTVAMRAADRDAVARLAFGGKSDPVIEAILATAALWRAAPKYDFPPTCDVCDRDLGPDDDGARCIGCSVERLFEERE